MIKVVEDFISEEEEMVILAKIFHSSVKRGANRNTITRYGSKLPYHAQSLKDIPEWALLLCQRLVDEGLSPELPDSVTVNEYMEGQIIDWHIDSMSSGPVINVLSLSSAARMGLRKGDERKEYLLNPRSLVHMSEEERYKWKHCIYPVEKRRYSIVFRKGTLIKKENARDNNNGERTSLDKNQGGSPD